MHTERCISEVYHIFLGSHIHGNSQGFFGSIEQHIHSVLCLVFHILLKWHVNKSKQEMKIVKQFGIKNGIKYRYIFL